MRRLATSTTHRDLRSTIFNSHKRRPMLLSRPILLFTAGLATTTPKLTSAFTLITLDVDGTLVSGTGWAESAHGRSYSRAVGQVLGDGGPVPPVPDVLETHEFHGSTDGLILLRMARAALGVQPAESAPRLDELMGNMYEYIASLTNEEVGYGLTVLPGVIPTLNTLSTMKGTVACGLVTGNVEGIARRKMSSVGILSTNALSPASAEQIRRPWPGSDSIGFLGGFGSDYCSGNIDDPERNYLDRGEQIAIAAERCQSMLEEEEGIIGKGRLNRVVHVGDAPADVLAAKSYSDKVANSNIKDGETDLCVGMVAVATGSYGAQELRECAGEPTPGRWEPVVLEHGLADPTFLEACGVVL